MTNTERSPENIRIGIRYLGGVSIKQGQNKRNVFSELSGEILEVRNEKS